MTRVEAGDDVDAALIDRLYGGPDSGGGGVADDDELEGLRMVRGLIARVRDEAPEIEPPQAVSALLLQAAGASAPKRAAAVEPERAGLWVRLRGWFATMAAHPAMAAAATLIVVAGATALWMRSGGEVAEPTHQAERPPARATAEPAEPAGPIDQLQNAPVGGYASPDPDPAAVVEPEAKVAPKKPKDSRPSTRKGGGAGSGEVVRDGLATTDRGDADKAVAPSGDRGGGESDDGRAEDAPTVTTTTQETVAPPPPPKAPEKKPAKKEAPPAEPTPDAVAVPREEQSGAVLAAEYTRQAIVAAQRGNCQTVEQLAIKAKAADARYYKASFETQADIKKCRAKSKG